MNILSLLFRKKKKKEIPYKTKTRYILAIDGGGTRGIIPAMVLEYMQKKINSLGSDKSIASYFDLISGTSTGGLIALALTCPNTDSFLRPYNNTNYNSAESIKDMYYSYSKEIFPKNNFSLKSINQLWKSKYDDESYLKLLLQAFEDITLDKSLVPVLAVSYDMIEGVSFNFTSSKTGHLTFKDAARATSAAPTYFDALNLEDIVNNKKYSLIDGGIIANNPSLFAYTEATKLYPNDSNFVIISLGTCRKGFNYGSESPSGVLGWANPKIGTTIQQVYSTSQMQHIDLIAKDLPNTEYYRINSEITGDKITLDATDEKDIKRLEETAVKLIEENKELLDNLCKRILEK